MLKKMLVRILRKKRVNKKRKLDKKTFDFYIFYVVCLQRLKIHPLEKKNYVRFQ
mgnify:CR=1 FL=1